MNSPLFNRLAAFKRGIRLILGAARQGYGIWPVFLFVFFASAIILRTGNVKAQEGADSNQAPQARGYIVVLKQQPLSAKRLDMQKQSGKYQLNKKAELQQLKIYRQNLKQQQANAQQEIKNVLGLSAVKKYSLKADALKGGATDLKIWKEWDEALNGFAVSLDEGEAKRIKSLPEVVDVYPDNPVKASLADSVPLIGADLVWKLDSQLRPCDPVAGNCLDGSGMRIGIIDTGIDYTHPDLGGCFGAGCKVAGGYDFVNNDSNPMDDMGHGTHVAAIVAGNGALKGVAPMAGLYAYKVLGADGIGYFSDIISAVERSIDPNGDGDASDHLDMINLSLNGPGSPDDPLSQAVDRAADAGVVVVASAGNYGWSENAIGSPGTARKAITVAATDKNDLITDFSSRGPVYWYDYSGSPRLLLKPDISAPGQSICAAEYDSAWDYNRCLDDRHIAISGTSMSAPHVAGAAALLKQARPDWTPSEIKLALTNSALSLGDEVNFYNLQQFGMGRLDILSAMRFPKPLVAQLDTESVFIGPDILVKGQASGNNFDSFGLSYKKYYDPGWTLGCVSNQPVIDGNLCDLGSLPNGQYVFRLDVLDVKGFTTTVYSVGEVEVPPPFVLRLNGGGAAYTDPSGNQWLADNSFSGGSGYFSSAPIAGTDSSQLYQDVRFGNFSYALDVPNGSYNVTLKFAEVYWSYANARKFNVSINNTQILSNFDIFSAAGGKNIAIDKTFPVTVTDGKINIKFDTITDNALVSAVEITGAGNIMPPVISSFTAVPEIIEPGQPSILFWAVLGATSLFINQGIGDVTNLTSKTVFPSTTTIYTLTATNSAGPVTKDVTVTVNDAPPVDTVPPTVALTSPAEGQTVSGTITVSADASDNVGITGVQFKADGKNIGSEDITAPYSISYDTAQLANGPHDFSAAARDAAGNIATSTVSVTVNNPVPPVEPVRINSGGPAYADISGNQWQADYSFSGGNAYSAADNISNTSDPKLYQSQRYGNFTYSFFAPDGTYDVKLKFAELYWGYTGARKFNVVLNGSQVLENFDIFAAAGGKDIAIDRIFPVTIVGGKLTIQFVTLTDNAAVNAIEIVPSGPPLPPDTTPPTITLASPTEGQTVSGTIAVSADASDNVGITGVQFKADGKNIGSEDITAPYSISYDTAQLANGPHDFSAAARDAAGNTSSATINVIVDNPLPPFVLRLNSGGAAYTDPSGNQWLADNSFSGGSGYFSSAPIAGTDSGQLYQDVRFGTFSYTLDVPDNSYNVTLKFAEIYWNYANARKFNVSINNTQVLSNFDIFASAGGKDIAIDKTFPVTVTDGKINIKFVTVADNALVNAIEITKR